MRTLIAVCFAIVIGTRSGAAAEPSAAEVAAAVDRLLDTEFQRTNTPVAPRTNDEDFLRRVYFDLAGTAPTPAQVTLFGLDPNPAKRTAVIEQLLSSENYAGNWAGYWRDVLFSRATNERAVFARGAFESWLTEQFRQNTSWDRIARSLITASGDVLEVGETALIFAHEGNAEEVASEVARIFLGIQLQCANCHDHPSDIWKREQFHELAAFFPRVAVRPVREGDRMVSFEVVSMTPPAGGRSPFDDPERAFRFLDRNRDGKLVKAEAERSRLAQAFDRLLARLDTDQDRALSLKEFQAFRPPQNQPGRGSAEHYMPNLDNPASRGTQMEPVFFVNAKALPSGESDVDRRQALAEMLTSPDNPWFARAVVNRLWSELLGEGFYMPVDDLGPEREPRHPEVLDALCEGFVASGHDLKWLLRTITTTEAYQRQIRTADPSETVVPFAAAQPTRLRSDQLYSALSQIFGIEPSSAVGAVGAGLYARRTPRDAFHGLFAFDPSTPPADITGNIPQALYLMNSREAHSLIETASRTWLGDLLRKFDDDTDAISELYLRVLSRGPSGQELTICRKYVHGIEDRGEAYEDLLWSLLNTSEFLTKR